VVLVTATDGSEGEPLVPLGRGETMAARRDAELEESCRLLGVQRLVKLGFRDSGMPGHRGNHHPRAYMNADVDAEARRLARLLAEESADALVHYDDNGIYGHPDHLAVHQIGAAAARLTGVTGYEATVDREHLHFVDTHIVRDAADLRCPPTLGRTSVEITTAIRATAAELAAKRAAMAVHASQIPADHLVGDGFDATYEHEWFIRAGAPRHGGLESLLGNEHLLH
jgi:LmbE family N-acetylglucosaminyl deacetylase